MKKLSKKLSLCYKTVSKGGMLEYLNDESIKDPIIQLLNKKEEVEIILKSHKENKFRFLYFNWKTIHDKLYSEESIDLDDDNYNISYTLSDLFYIDLIIMSYEETKEFNYSLKFINNINNIQKNIIEEDKYAKLAYAKIIIDLINFIIKTNDVDDLDQEILEEIKISNEKIIENSLNEIRKSFIGIDNYFSGEEIFKIDEIYSFIIDELIINNKFDNEINISNILEQLDLKNIILTNTMLEKLKGTLVSENIAKHKISESKDYLSKSKINFFYILYEYILKSPFYIYKFDFFEELKKDIISFLKTNPKVIINSLNDNSDKNKIIFVINTYTGSDYFYGKYINESEFIELYNKELFFELDYNYGSKYIKDKTKNFKNKLDKIKPEEIINFKVKEKFIKYKKEIEILINYLNQRFLFYNNLIINVETKTDDAKKIILLLTLFKNKTNKEKEKLKSFSLINAFENDIYNCKGFLYFINYINKKFNKPTLYESDDDSNNPSSTSSISLLNETKFYQCKFYKFNRIQKILNEKNKYSILAFEKKIAQYKSPIETILEMNNCYLSYVLDSNIDYNIHIYNNNFEKIDFVLPRHEKAEENSNVSDKDIIIPSYKGVYLLQFNEEQSKITNIINLIPEPSNIFLVMNKKSMILCNKNKNYIKIFISLTQEKAPKRANIFSGIKIGKNNAIFLSKSDIINEPNELLFYDDSKENITKIELEDNYYFFLSRNNLEIMPNEKGIKIYLLCGCKNNKNENGIFILNLLSSKEMFLPTNNFEAYCFCPIFILKKTKEGVNKNYYTNYFFAGGLDTKKNRGKINLYKLISEDENNLKGIEFTQEIIFENDEFNDSLKIINYITQSKKTGKIIISCLDGSVYLLSEPNISIYLIDDEETRQRLLNKPKLFQF